MTNTETITRQAEEAARIDAEVAEANVGPATVTAEQLREQMKGTGAELGGLTSSSEDVPVYNRYDGTSSNIPSDQLRQRLTVRFDAGHPKAGELVWTTKAPESPPKLGTMKCPLHSESDEREYMDGLNFIGILCLKATMKTQFDVNQHFKGKHKSIHAAVEQDKDRQMKEQQMDLMRQQTAAMQAVAAQGRQNGAAQATEAAPPALTETAEAAAEVRCHSCNEVIEGKLGDHSC